MNIAEVWEVCIALMWNSSYVNGLASFLKENNVNTILDCGGGTGFPSIELKKLGWNISYCDSNEKMIKHFSGKLNESKLDIPIYQNSWLELSKNISHKFDAILCRGNSLIYVNSWDVKNPTVNKENIKRVLQEFYNQLNNNGLLYVDIINKKEFNQKYPLIENIGERIINGKRVKIAWKITHFPEKKMRKCDIIFHVDGQKSITSCYSYLLTHKELFSLMTECGFKNIHEVMILGENNYNVYVGYK